MNPLVPLIAPVVFLLLLACASDGAAMPVGDGAAVRSGPPDGRVEVRLSDLASIRRAFRAFARHGAGIAERERLAAWGDFSLVAEVVLGAALVGAESFDDLAGQSTDRRVLATPGVAGRDAAAYRLLALGYSARETADIVGGRVSRRGADAVRLMSAVGRGRDAALVAAAHRAAAPRAAAVVPPAPTRAARGPFDALIEQYARLYRVEAAVVRAIIETESSFDPHARSHKGAIGLMQLMPATARELGVDPFVPEQNIEAGVRYFSRLLETFGRIELALAAYNAGPAAALRYVRGGASLPSETRAYVRNVLARLGAAD